MEVQFRASTCVENCDHSMAGEGLCACRKACRGKWTKKLVRTRLDDYPSLKGGGLMGETEEVAPWFYRCRYCGRWKDSGAFSSGQVQWASESDFSRGPRRGRRRARLQRLRRLRFTPGTGRFRDRGCREPTLGIPLRLDYDFFRGVSGLTGVQRRHSALHLFLPDGAGCPSAFISASSARHILLPSERLFRQMYIRLQHEDLVRRPSWQMWEMEPFAAPSACATSPACRTSCSTSKHQSAMCALVACIRSVDTAAGNLRFDLRIAANTPVVALVAATTYSSDCGSEFCHSTGIQTVPYSTGILFTVMVLVRASFKLTLARQGLRKSFGSQSMYLRQALREAACHG